MILSKSNDNELKIDITADSSEAQKELKGIKQKLNSALDTKKLNKTLSATSIAVKEAFKIKPIDAFTGSVKTATDTVSKFSKTFGAIAAGIAALGGLRSAVDGVINKGDDLVTLADRLRITTKEAKTLQATLSMGSGMDVEQFTTAMGRLRGSLNSNTKAAQETKNMLTALGVAYKDESGHILSYDKLMSNIAAGYEKVQVAGYDTEYMMQLFGNRAEAMTETVQKWKGAVEKAAQVKGTMDMGIDPQRLAALHDQVDILDAQAAKFKDVLGQLFVPFAEQSIPTAINALQTMAQFLSENKEQIRTIAKYASEFAAVWVAQNTVMKIATAVMGIYKTAVASVTGEMIKEGTQAVETAGEVEAGNVTAAKSFDAPIQAVAKMTSQLGNVTAVTVELGATFKSAMVQSEVAIGRLSELSWTLTKPLQEVGAAASSMAASVTKAESTMQTGLVGLDKAIEGQKIALNALSNQWKAMGTVAEQSSAGINTANKAILQGLRQQNVSLAALETAERKAIQQYVAGMKQVAVSALEASNTTLKMAKDMDLSVSSAVSSVKKLDLAMEELSFEIHGMDADVMQFGRSATTAMATVEKATVGVTTTVSGLAGAMTTLTESTVAAAGTASKALSNEATAAQEAAAALNEAGVAGTEQGMSTAEGATIATEALEREAAAANQETIFEIKAGEAAQTAQAKATQAHNTATGAIKRQSAANAELAAKEVIAGNEGETAGKKQTVASTIATGAVRTLSGAVRALASNWLLVAWATYEAINALQAYNDEKLEESIKAQTNKDVDVGRAGGMFGIGGDSYYIDPMNGSLRKNKIVADEAPDGSPIGTHNVGEIVTDPKEVDRALKAIEERKKARGRWKYDKLTLPETPENPFFGGSGSYDGGGGGSDGGGSSGADDAAKKAEEALKELNEALKNLQNKVFDFDATNFEKSLRDIDEEAKKVKDTIKKAQDNGLDTSELESTLSTWQTRATQEAEKAVKKAQESIGHETASMIAETANDALQKAKVAYNKAWLELDKEIEEKKKEVMRNSDDTAALNAVYEYEAAKKEKIAKEYQQASINAAIDVYNKELELTNASTEAYRTSTIVRDTLNRSTLDKEISYLEKALAHERLTTQQRIDLLNKLAEAKKKVRDIPLTAQEAISNGLQKAYESFGTYYENLANLTNTTAVAMRDGFANSFFDAMQGQLKSFGEYLCDFLNSVQKAIAQFMANAFASNILKGIFPTMGFNAVGGYEPIGSSFIVGENGPELVNLTGAGAHITSTHTTQRKMSSSNVGGECNVVVNVINESGTQVNAEQGPTSFDGDKYIVGVILNAYSKNTMGMRDMIRSR